MYVSTLIHPICLLVSLSLPSSLVVRSHQRYHIQIQICQVHPMFTFILILISLTVRSHYSYGVLASRYHVSRSHCSHSVLSHQRYHIHIQIHQVHPTFTFILTLISLTVHSHYSYGMLASRYHISRSHCSHGTLASKISHSHSDSSSPSYVHIHTHPHLSHGTLASRYQVSLSQCAHITPTACSHPDITVTFQVHSLKQQHALAAHQVHPHHARGALTSRYPNPLPRTAVRSCNSSSLFSSHSWHTRIKDIYAISIVIMQVFGSH